LTPFDGSGRSYNSYNRISAFSLFVYHSWLLSINAVADTGLC